MIIASPRTFTFPSRGRIAVLRGIAPEAQAKDDAAIKEAIARGYAEGLAQARRVAEAEAKSIIDAARNEGFEAGRRQAIAQVEQSAAALREALEAFERERHETVCQAEKFCVDLVLAIISRLVEVDTVRSEFASRLVARGIEALAPEPPRAIYLNPADRALIASSFDALPLKDDPTLQPGHARIEAGRLVVEGGIEEAFQQIRYALIDVEERRALPNGDK